MSKSVADEYAENALKPWSEDTSGRAYSSTTDLLTSDASLANALKGLERVERK